MLLHNLRNLYFPVFEAAMRSLQAGKLRLQLEDSRAASHSIQQEQKRREEQPFGKKSRKPFSELWVFCAWHAQTQIEIPNSQFPKVFFLVFKKRYTSSARTSRGRKFPKGKELYSTERICL